MIGALSLNTKHLKMHLRDDCNNWTMRVRKIGVFSLPNGMYSQICLTHFLLVLWEFACQRQTWARIDNRIHSSYNGKAGEKSRRYWLPRLHDGWMLYWYWDKPLLSGFYNIIIGFTYIILYGVLLCVFAACLHSIFSTLHNMIFLSIFKHTVHPSSRLKY